MNEPIGTFELSVLRDGMGANVMQIRNQATRVIRGGMPMAVRRELLAAVNLGQLGRLKKDGLKPEIFFHPDHRHGAIDRQKREAAYSISRIASVMVSGKQMLEIEKLVTA
jgi:hypothetical protein